MAWAGVAGMSDFDENPEVQRSEHEHDIFVARANLRHEREKIISHRAEAERLLAEARVTHQEANRIRERARHLAVRFVRRVKQHEASAQRQHEEQKASLEADRHNLQREIARFENVRSQFHRDAASARNRLRDAWAAVRAQQKRTSGDWIEAHRLISEENSKLKARAKELARQEKNLVDHRAKIEAETAGLRVETSTLESRVENARTALIELEARRDRARAELLGTELPAELSVLVNADDLGEREQVLAREKAAVTALRSSLEQEASDVNDSRRIVAEQLKMLEDARAKWQRAEQHTVIEMEQLAQELGEREQEVIAREQHLIRVDARRREETYDLWQLRLRLESWQTKLTAFEMRWHTEREELESDFERRVSLVTRRETELESTFETWQKARERERERLRAELELWADDRKRLEDATADFERRRNEFLSELAQFAARALAAEQLVANALRHNGSNRGLQRLAVLRKRWEWEFERKSREIDHQRAEASVERATVDERYEALQELLKHVTEREAAIEHQETASFLMKGSIHRELWKGTVNPDAKSSSQSSELTALRNEVERLATMMLEIELPEAPDEPIKDPLWVEEETNSSGVLPIDSGAWAA